MNSSGRRPEKSSRTCSRSESAATSGDRRSSSKGARKPPIRESRGSGEMGSIIGQGHPVREGRWGCHASPPTWERGPAPPHPPTLHPPCSRLSRDWLGSVAGDEGEGDDGGTVVAGSAALSSSPEEAPWDGVFPGLIPPSLSSGHRKTSMGPCLLLREI